MRTFLFVVFFVGFCSMAMAADLGDDGPPPPSNADRNAALVMQGFGMIADAIRESHRDGPPVYYAPPPPPVYYAPPPPPVYYYQNPGYIPNPWQRGYYGGYGGRYWGGGHYWHGGGGWHGGYRGWNGHGGWHGGHHGRW